MRQNESLFTCDVKLASALVTMGCQPLLPMIERVCDNGKTEICYFHFICTPDCKAYIAAWEAIDDTWSHKDFPGHALADREHRFWYVRAALRNRERYLDSVKRHSVLHIVKRSGKTF